MDELQTEWVVRALSGATSDIEPSPDLDARVAAILREGGRRRRRGRRAVPLLAACVAVVVAVGAVVFVRRTADEGGRRVQVIAPTPGRPSDPRWLETTPSPWGGAPRAASLVWTGREAIVWGGIPDLPGSPGGAPATADGAAYDPATDTWRRLPPAPISARSNHVAVWTGKDMLVWGGSGPLGWASDGAAYNPTSDTWRSIARGPVGRVSRDLSGQPAVWTGSEMLVWGRSEPGGAGSGGAYNPTTDSWRLLPALPGDSPVLVWTGQLVLAFGRLSPPITGPGSVATTVEGDELDPKEGTWRPLAPSRLGPRSWAAAWTGDELLVVGLPPRIEGRLTARYRPADRAWHDMAPIPITDRWSSVVLEVWTGDELLVVGYGGGGAMAALTYSPAEDRWRTVPPPAGITSAVQVVQAAGGALALSAGRLLRFVS